MTTLSLLKYIGGYLEVVLSGYAPERFLNLCGNHNILIWNLRKEEDVYQHSCILEYPSVCKQDRMQDSDSAQNRISVLDEPLPETKMLPDGSNSRSWSGVVFITIYLECGGRW